MPDGEQTMHTDHQPSRLRFLDALRGIAAIVVVAIHMVEQLWPGFAAFRYTVFDPGTWGVTVFFLCSGFVIPISLERSGSLRHFWLRRICRLFPLYWLSIALAGLVYAVLGVDVSPGLLSGSRAAVLANLTMLQTFFGFDHILYVYWTLTYEMVFYVLVSLLFVLNVSRKSSVLAVGFCAAAVLAEVVLPALTGTKVPVGLVSSIATMLVGSMWYRVHAKQATPRQGIAIGGAGVLMIVVTTIGAGALRGDSWFYVFLLITQVAAYATFAAAFALRARGTPAALVFLGRISYSLYLLHLLVLKLIPARGTAHPILTMLLFLACCVCLASIAYYAVERPAIWVGQRLTRGLPVRVRTAATVLPRPADPGTQTVS